MCSDIAYVNSKLLIIESYINENLKENSIKLKKIKKLFQNTSHLLLSK